MATQQSVIATPIEPGSPVARFPMLVRWLVPPGTAVSRDEIRAILKVAFLSAEADLDEDPDEMAPLRLVGRKIWELLGYEPEPLPIVSPLPLPIDHEARMAVLRELAPHLVSTPARELAYALAYLFTVLDLELAPVEDTFLDGLRRVLQLDLIRATELAATTSEIMTPGVGDATKEA